MHRIDTEGSDEGQFRDGNPQIGQGGTIMSFDWFNDVQENLCGVIEGAGIELEKGDYGQLQAAITAMIAAGVAAATAAARVKPGIIDAFGGPVAPAGYLECDGAAISRTTYADLFAAIGTAWGVGDGTTTFNLPDLRGEFLRGWDHGRGVDAARTLGSAQADMLKAHDHAIPARDNANSGDGSVEDADNTGATRTTSTGSTGGAETRPRNMAVMYVIKT